MDSKEFEERFDVLYNNITSNQAPGLNTYEKSVMLTKAQDEVVKNHFSANSKGNDLQQGFDDSAKRQIDFSMLTTTKKNPQNSETSFASGNALFDPRDNSKSIKMEEDIMMILNEIVTVKRSNSNCDLLVVPIRFDEYNRLMSKPFKRPLKNQAWRLINSDTENRADIIVGPKDEIVGYRVRYIRTPKPIIIGELDDEMTINGYVYGDPATAGSNAKVANGCELDEILHEEILQRAVELAKIAWTGTGQDNMQAVMQAGQRSE